MGAVILTRAAAGEYEERRRCGASETAVTIRVPFERGRDGHAVHEKTARNIDAHRILMFELVGCGPEVQLKVQPPARRAGRAAQF